MSAIPTACRRRTTGLTTRQLAFAFEPDAALSNPLMRLENRASLNQLNQSVESVIRWTKQPTRLDRDFGK
jgi:hypothetical protein